MSYFFSVKGKPVPKGSTRAFKHAKTGSVINLQTNEKQQKLYAAMIKLAFKKAYPDAFSNKCAYHMKVLFKYERPKSHLTSKGVLRKGAPLHKVTVPDLDKLIRCVKDALTSVIWDDDKQVVSIDANKIYSSVEDDWTIFQIERVGSE